MSVITKSLLSAHAKLNQWAVKLATKESNGNNILGDRDVEWSWVASQLPETHSGRLLDFGAGSSPLGLLSALKGYMVTSIDLETQSHYYEHPKLNFMRGDILRTNLPALFDVIINCSSIEHVGLAGRYGVTEDNRDGDIKAMSKMGGLLTEHGIMILTMPVGQDAVYPAMHRVYGRERLPRLLTDFTILKGTYWLKDKYNRWSLTEREKALDFQSSGGSVNPLNDIFALGCFVLGKKQ
jgi:SAM-dependent methyltransferase